MEPDDAVVVAGEQARGRVPQRPRRSDVATDLVVDLAVGVVVIPAGDAEVAGLDRRREATAGEELRDPRALRELAATLVVRGGEDVADVPVRVVGREDFGDHRAAVRPRVEVTDVAAGAVRVESRLE